MLFEKIGAILLEKGCMRRLSDLIVEYNSQKDDNKKEIVLSRIILAMAASVREKNLLPILTSSISLDDSYGYNYHVNCLTHHGTPQVLADLDCRNNFTYCNDRESVFCIEIGQFLSEIKGPGDFGMVQVLVDHNNRIDLGEEDVAQILDPQKRICVLKGDITVLPADAVINSANDNYTDSSGGVNHEILHAAGPIVKEELLCAASESTNHYVTSGGALPSQKIIHVKVPKVDDYNSDPDTLYHMYRAIFNLAKAQNLHVLAVPALGTGKKGIPKKDAAEVAIHVAQKWMVNNPEYDLFVVFVTYNQDTYREYMDRLRNI